MKKLTALLMSLVCVFAMAACAPQEPEETTEPGYAVSDLQAMVDAGAFSEELEELDADTAFLLYKLADYGLAREDMTQAAVLRSAGATCEEGAVLIFADTEKAAVAAEAMGDYVEGQIEANVDYRPNEIPKLEGAVLKIQGASVMLVVPNDAAAVRNVLEK